MSKILRTEIELRDPKSLKPYSHNNKKHGDGQIKKLMTTIAEHGFDQPIVVDSQGVIIKGHARREASLRMGLKLVPVIVASDLTPEQARGARLADNAIADDGQVDLESIRFELEDLDRLGYNLTLTGFDDEELDNLMSGIEQTECQPSQMFGGGSQYESDENYGDSEPSYSPDSNRNSAGSQNQDRFPLPIVLSWQEWQEWKARKEDAGIKSDKAMLLKLMEV